MVNFQNKQCLTTVIVIIAAIVAFFYIVYPNLNMNNNVAEGFEEEQLAEVIPEPEVTGEDKNAPYINPNTGSIMDGPGFEKGDDGIAEIEGVPEQVANQIPSNFYFLDDGADGEMSIQHNMCSKSCCSEQWPTPFKQKYDPYVCGNKDKFVGSNIMCNNSFQDSGCLCLTKKQAKFLYNRGYNGREWF